MKFILGLIAFVAVVAVRVLFYMIGWVFVPLTLLGDGAKRTPPLWRPVYGNVEDIAEHAKKNRWTKYVEMAWRNPTNGMAGWFDQPVPETQPNPDVLVRVGKMHNGAMVKQKSASRYMQDGIYWEYWYLRQIDFKTISLFGAKHYRWFEFRIGWKFVDGNDEFFPTFQLGPRSS